MRRPVIGNGDVLTHYQARERLQRAGIDSLMWARGALIKPWLLREIREGRGWEPSAAERVGVLWRFVVLLREYFRNDGRGRARSRRFLVWHFPFFARYRPLPEAEFGALALERPLIHVRHRFGEDLEPLEALLRDGRPEVHERLAALIADADAERRLRELAGDVAAEPAPAAVDTAPEQVAG